MASGHRPEHLAPPEVVIARNSLISWLYFLMEKIYDANNVANVLCFSFTMKQKQENTLRSE